MELLERSKDTIKEVIYDFLQEHRNAYNRLQLASKIKIEGKEHALFLKALKELKKEEAIFQNRHGDFELFVHPTLLKGIMRMHKKGFGFVSIEGQEDLFVRNDDVRGAYDGDEVLIRKIPDPMHQGKFAARVEKILKHEERCRVGEVISSNKEYFQIQPDEPNFLARVFLEKKQYPQIAIGHKILFKPQKYLQQHNILAELFGILGHVNDPGVDILSIVSRYQIPTEFSQEIYDVLRQLPEEVSLNEVNRRKDLREKMILTIDGADAKDLDDAVSLEIDEEGHFILGVHIADVSHYVEKGGLIDQEAFERGTSVYLADRVIPMLPQSLSNGICSLHPDVDRLTLTCEMVIDYQGNIVRKTFYESVIRSKVRMTYKDVNLLLTDKDAELAKKYADFVDTFKEMKKLSDILQRKRWERGALDFNIDEAKIIVDESGKTIDVQKRERGESEKLIEQFMIEANEAVASAFFEKNLPFIYRVHDVPKDAKLEVFKKVTNSLGIKTAGLKLDGQIKPKALQQLLLKINEKPQHSLLSTLVLRSMQKAIYDNENIGHFGLASKDYTHFTSPIRRYPDLIVHRLLKHYFITGHDEIQAKSYNEEMLHEIAIQASKTERRAIECERDVEMMKMAEYMEKRIGETYEGILSGVTQGGLYVELTNMIEGYIPIEALIDDYYFFEEEQLTLRGRRTNRQFKMGDKVKIVVASANKKTATIRFDIADLHGKEASFHFEKRQNKRLFGQTGRHTKDGNKSFGHKKTYKKNDDKKRVGKNEGSSRKPAIKSEHVAANRGTQKNNQKNRYAKKR